MLQSNIKSLYKQIVELNSYTPSKKVNNLFSSLVKKALNNKSENFLKANELAKLQQICSLSEYELEKYWAEKIVNSFEPLKVLESFPYINNYRKLTRMEFYSLISCSKHKKHNVLFVGGGPLPLTAIVLAKDYGQRVTILEKDNEAFNLSKKLVNKLGLTKNIKIINIDATYFVGYSEFNAIIVAALAGISRSSKKLILERIKDISKKETHILARSSWGNRKVLYRPIDASIFKMFKTELEVRPHNDVINSVIIFKT